MTTGMPPMPSEEWSTSPDVSNPEPTSPPPIVSPPTTQDPVRFAKRDMSKIKMEFANK